MSEIKLKKRCKYAGDIYKSLLIFEAGYDAKKAGDFLDRIPDADVEEVVRCKECKHWHKETGWCAEHSFFIDADGEFCHPWESANWKMFDDNDFCSYGERKEQ